MRVVKRIEWRGKMVNVKLLVEREGDVFIELEEVNKLLFLFCK